MISQLRDGPSGTLVTRKPNLMLPIALVGVASRSDYTLRADHFLPSLCLDILYSRHETLRTQCLNRTS